MIRTVLMILMFVLPAQAADKSLNLYIWSDYLAPDTIANFTKATGISVHVDLFDTSELLEAKMLAGSAGYDVIVPNGATLARLAKAGVVAPLDRARLKNIGTQDPAILARAGEMGDAVDHGIVYMWGTTGLGINTARVKAALGADAALDSWSLILDPANAAKLASCGIYVFDSATDVFQQTLAYIGRNPRSTDPADYEAAAAVWAKVRPYVTQFHNSEYISALANGDICIAMGYSGDVFQARDRANEAKNGVKIDYVIPREGAMMWFDFMAIPKDAPHPDAAHAFLDYILKPDVIAAISGTVHYANANTQATPLMPAALRNDKTVYPDAAVMARLFPEIIPPQPLERLRTRLWNRIKSGS
jgi:putrescine transport system substrate-binding protein